MATPESNSWIKSVPSSCGWLASSLETDHPIVVAREERGEATWPCLAGQRWIWDGVAFEMLHPVEASYDNPRIKPNDLSCVLRVSNTAGSALLTGDIEARTEAELVCLRGKWGIEETAVKHITDICFHERCQQFGATPGATAARVIGALCNYDRSPVGLVSHLDGFFQWRQCLDEPLPISPAALGNLRGQGTSVNLVVARCDYDAYAILGTIGENETSEDRDIQYIARQLRPSTGAIIDEIAVWAAGGQQGDGGRCDR